MVYSIKEYNRKQKKGDIEISTSIICQHKTYYIFFFDKVLNFYPANRLRTVETVGDCLWLATNEESDVLDKQMIGGGKFPTT